MTLLTRAVFSLWIGILWVISSCLAPTTTQHGSGPEVDPVSDPKTFWELQTTRKWRKRVCFYEFQFKP